MEGLVEKQTFNVFFHPTKFSDAGNNKILMHKHGFFIRGCSVVMETDMFHCIFWTSGPKYNTQETAESSRKQVSEV